MVRFVFAYPVPMKRIKTWEELTIQDNFLFQKVMRDERLCRRLLERLLGITICKIDFPQRVSLRKSPPQWSG